MTEYCCEEHPFCRHVTGITIEAEVTAAIEDLKLTEVKLDMSKVKETFEKLKSELEK